MKTLFYIFFFLVFCGNSLDAQNYYYTLDQTPISTTNGATTYYVSSTGNDENSGTSENSAWQSLTKVNSFTPIPGDRILFKRGDTFYGSITINSSGSSESPIVFGAYGVGDDPIISGFTTLLGWTDEGGGVYSKVITSSSQTNMVTIDGIQYGMGRYPETGYLTYESSSTMVSITDNQLPDYPSWVGAEAVINKNLFALDRTIITAQSSGTISYTSLASDYPSYKTGEYFIQNDIRTLTKFGNWYHDKPNDKFYMYFGAIDPATKVVRVATLDGLILSYHNYISLIGLTTEGSIKDNIYLTGVYNGIQNCHINNSGLTALSAFGANTVIDGNTIMDSNRNAIYSYGGNATITNNTITNVGAIEGQGSIDYTYIGAVVVFNNNCLVQYNKITNTGNDGIFLAHNIMSGSVENNLLQNTCMYLSDQGAIYADQPRTALLIKNNFIIGSGGDGIYLDELAANIEVSNNTVYGCLGAAIKLHKAHDNSISDNTCYNNGRGLSFENWINLHTLYNNDVTGNKIISKGGQYVGFYSNYYDGDDNIGTLSNNYYARPIDDNTTFLTYTPSYSLKTLTEWKSLIGSDIDSSKSPIAITDESEIRFEYNYSNVPKSISLDFPMIDVMGSEYSSSIILQPYSSVILIKKN